MAQYCILRCINEIVKIENNQNLVTSLEVDRVASFDSLAEMAFVGVWDQVTRFSNFLLYGEKTSEEKLIEKR
jgi:hypothetical protein